MDFGANAGVAQFSQPPRTKPHHRRVPSDPFEFDEPIDQQTEKSSPMFSTLRCPTDGFGSIYFDNDDDTAMTVVDDSLSSGSDSDDCATMVEDMDFPNTSSGTGAVVAAAGGGECSGHRSMPSVTREGPANEIWNDVDSWMLNMDAPTDQHGAADDDGSWLNSCTSGPFDLVPVGGPGRSSSLESSMSDGVTPTALPIMTPCSNAPSPAPAPGHYDASNVGEKRARFSTGASPQHRMVKINRHGSARNLAAHAEASPTVPMGGGGGGCNAADCEPPPLLQKPLPAEVAARMLHDDSYAPGVRPVIFNAAGGQWLFKEKSRGRAAPHARCTAHDRSNDRADRWHNSGGVRGARDMPKNATPLVRRRYGSVAQNGEILWRFHEYSALTVVPDLDAPNGQRIDEDRSTVVFHVMPKRSGKGRPSKAEAELPAQMWKAFGWTA